MVLLIHQIFATVFSLYIVVDRFIFRRFIPKEKRELFYSKSKLPLVVVVMFLIISGSILLYRYGFTTNIVLKVTSSLVLLFMFFNCPNFMKRAKCDDCKKIYRSFVTLILLLVVFLGLSV